MVLSALVGGCSAMLRGWRSRGSLGLVMMLQGSVATLLGPNVTRGLLFPLFYMFFLVPIGEEAVPALQTLTAKMCMVLLGWTGIPAHIDGIFITTPTGYFRVAEACSGVKFLIAMVAYGVLVANLCFKSWGRRAAFLAVCVIVPILANGLRAFGTIYIAHHQGIEFAASFDHVFYGWIFFGIVIALVMAAGWPFFDKRADAPAFDPATLQSPVSRTISLNRAFAASLLIAAVPLGWSSYVAAKASPVPARIMLPDVAGWQVVPYAPLANWTPRFDGASHYLFGRYRNAAGQEADLFVVLYDRQSRGSRTGWLRARSGRSRRQLVMDCRHSRPAQRQSRAHQDQRRGARGCQFLSRRRHHQRLCGADQTGNAQGTPLERGPAGGGDLGLGRAGRRPLAPPGHRRICQILGRYRQSG